MLCVCELRDTKLLKLIHSNRAKVPSGVCDAATCTMCTSSACGTAWRNVQNETAISIKGENEKAPRNNFSVQMHYKIWHSLWSASFGAIDGLRDALCYVLFTIK